MKATAMILLPLCGATMSGCLGKLAMIGLDKDGQPVVTHVAEGKYVEHLADGIQSIHESVVPVLGTHADTAGQWHLCTVVVGIETNGSVGIGPFQVGIQPGIRVAFQNSPNAILP